jgi:hypothetical protein
MIREQGNRRKQESENGGEEETGKRSVGRRKKGKKQGGGGKRGEKGVGKRHRIRHVGRRKGEKREEEKRYEEEGGNREVEGKVSCRRHRRTQKITSGKNLTNGHRPMLFKISSLYTQLVTFYEDDTLPILLLLYSLLHGLQLSSRGYAQYVNCAKTAINNRKYSR